MVLGGDEDETVKQSVNLRKTNIIHGLFLSLYIVYFKCCHIMAYVFIKYAQDGEEERGG